MKRTIKFIFFILVEVLFLWIAFSCIYVATSWRNNNYLSYLPEHRIYPQYDLDGKVTNSDEVTFWSASDYVPTLNMVIENLFDWGCRYGLAIYLVFLLLIAPIYYFTRQEKNNLLLVVAYYQLLMISGMMLVWL